MLNNNDLTFESLTRVKIRNTISYFHKPTYFTKVFVGNCTTATRKVFVITVTYTFADQLQMGFN